MLTLKSYVGGQWVEGQGQFRTLVNPCTEEAIAQCSTAGVDFKAALEHARKVGGPALRALSFEERASRLKTLSKAFYEHREELIDLAMKNGGNTRGDAKFDIDGATGTLSAYAGFGKSLGATHHLLDGTGEQLSRNPRYAGQHICLPRQGAAVHINAYNFPAWGFGEKAAVALLAGMPVITKPATSTALLTVRMFEIALECGAFPEGALSVIAGSVGDLLDHMGPQDVLSFTGGSDTAQLLRRHETIIKHSIPFNVEADSLNSAILGLDAELGSDTFHMMIREAFKDATQKTGQKCTAIRRVLVPESLLDEVVQAFEERMSEVKTGNVFEDGVRMGPLVSKSQVQSVRDGIAALAKQASKVCGDAEPTGLPGVKDGQGYFVTPHLFKLDDARQAPVVHEHEVFGPVLSVMPYKDVADAADIIASGGGGLVSSVYSDDRGFAKDMLMAIAPFHGRLTLGNAKVAEHSPGPGTVMPQMVHGGPGRAGGGEELGGLRGLSFYMQRTAIQGYRPLLEKFFGKAEG